MACKHCRKDVIGIAVKGRDVDTAGARVFHECGSTTTPSRFVVARLNLADFVLLDADCDERDLLEARKMVSESKCPRIYKQVE